MCVQNNLQGFFGPTLQIFYLKTDLTANKMRWLVNKKGLKVDFGRELTVSHSVL